jgi:hypothetical protein
LLYDSNEKRVEEMKQFQVIFAVAILVVGTAMVSPAQAGGLAGCCAPTCAPEPVCCVKPLPPVKVTLCVKDPVTCCTYAVDLCVPAECACEEPCLVSCRPGIFGRKVLTYKWPCCGHCVEIVITKHGKTIVR